METIALLHQPTDGLLFDRTLVMPQRQQHTDSGIKLALEGNRRRLAVTAHILQKGDEFTGNGDGLRLGHIDRCLGWGEGEWWLRLWRALSHSINPATGRPKRRRHCGRAPTGRPLRKKALGRSPSPLALGLTIDVLAALGLHGSNYCHCSLHDDKARPTHRRIAACCRWLGE